MRAETLKGCPDPRGRGRAAGQGRGRRGRRVRRPGHRRCAFTAELVATTTRRVALALIGSGPLFGGVWLAAAAASGKVTIAVAPGLAVAAHPQCRLAGTEVAPVRRTELADPVIGVRGLKCIQDFQQCRLGKGHRALCPFTRTIGVGLADHRNGGRFSVVTHALAACYLHHPVGRHCGFGGSGGAVVPARRSARLDLLTAIGVEWLPARGQPCRPVGRAEQRVWTEQ